MTNFSPATQGIIWIVLSCMGNAVMVSLVRYLSFDLHPFQITFLRNVMALLLFLPWLCRVGLNTVRTEKFHMYSSRAIYGVIAMHMYFYALAVVPLAQAIALSFVSPLITAVAAVMVFKEETRPGRWVALIAGFVGVIIVLQPGFDNFSYISLLVLVAASAWSISSLIIKSLTRSEKPEVIVFYMALLMTPLSLPGAIAYWKDPQPELWLWIILLGVSSNFFQLCLSKAFAKTELTVLLPFDFSRLIFTSVIAYFIFSEKPDVFTYAGASIILGSAVYITYSEARKHKNRKK